MSDFSQYVKTLFPTSEGKRVDSLLDNQEYFANQIKAFEEIKTIMCNQLLKHFIHNILEYIYSKAYN